VLHLAVLGSLFQKLQEFIEENSVNGVSLFQCALASELRNQLSGYSYLLAGLECQLANPNLDVTLNQLRVETFAAKRHLEWLVAAVEACRHRMGCNILSVLYFLMLSGNPRAFENISPIFLKVNPNCVKAQLSLNKICFCRCL